ncbi:DoxX family protein [Dyadobacter sp. CY347]|uniref:DoxX family protein n=1 Tax=Dyadobacter sp. CY347 TaxID=2909336 RepID=UPI001F1E4527|nr:DoxX family protein [Dyadobacter sp. CY347]MCF2490845.1 DoxX family protein [Dyadobacter sp. CY347]
MKTTRIIFWISTTLIFLFEGVMPALTSQTEMAREGIRHLGYPDYFGPMLTGFKIAGSLALILPKVPSRLKEWAYAGFVFDFLCASISTTVVDGFGFNSVFPLIVLAVLMVSYYSYHKLQAAEHRTHVY